MGANVEVRFDDGVWYAGQVVERNTERARPYKVRYVDGSLSWHALNLATGEADTRGRRVRLNSSSSPHHECKRKPKPPKAAAEVLAGRGGRTSAVKRRRMATNSTSEEM